MNLKFLMRMTRVARSRPTEQKFWVMAAIVAIIFVVFGFERLFGWPDWLTIDRQPRYRG